jgi:hypothetical protein
MEKSGFIYIWFDKKRKMYYIGCHYGTENDGYVCSSKRMREAYRRRPNDFKRRIIKRNIDRNVMLEEEYRWLSLIPDDQLGKKYYNLSNRHFGHWSQSQSKILSMKERNLGKNNPMFGKTPWIKGKFHTEESKKRIKEKRAKQIITEETCNKISKSHMGEKNPFFGKSHTEESKTKMSEKAKNRVRKPVSQETKKKLSEIAKNRPKDHPSNLNMK